VVDFADNSAYSEIERPLTCSDFRVPFSNLQFGDADDDDGDDDCLNGYSDSEIENISNMCQSRGVCQLHESDLADLTAKLGYSEDVYIADLCSSIDRKMWWNESTPLMIACLEGGSILVKVLLLLGADVSATNTLDSTGRQ
jgi:hypothetical protein